eukprot:TRINITY_DN9114_c0_g1_i1.p1 TRINITY_DN9114_c0_g1~~TRINITY_DN9114_c0_g1_i1.p1  ORF type:complete len:780 (+),score=119.62 TRINITY_DN9114_c0_g1_i1:36-2342(+)
MENGIKRVESEIDLTPRTLSRRESLPSPSIDRHSQVVRVNCLYVSRKQLRSATDAFNVSHVRSDASVVLAPGLQATVQVVQASKAVKAHVVFDFKIGRTAKPKLLDLQSEIRKNLSIPLGVELQLQIIPSNGDHTVKITTDAQLAEAISVHQEELTIQVMKSGIRLYLPWIAIIVSILDVVTTVLFATELLHHDDTPQRIVGASVAVATVVAVVLNLIQGFLHIKRSINAHGPAHEWVTVHICETAFGLLFAGLNLLNLECLWSHFDVLSCFNFHCPMPRELRRMSGKASIPSLVLGDGMPIAASIFEIVSSGGAGWYSIASVSTSLASLALSLAKKVIVMLFVEGGRYPNGDADDDTQNSKELASMIDNTTDLLKRRDITLLKFHLDGIPSLEQRPRALAALACKFHEVCFMSVRSQGGMVVSFTEDSVEAVFNAPREVRLHPVAAVLSALNVVKAWPEARFAALQSHKSGFTITTSVVTGEGHVGNLGPRTRREYKVVGEARSELDELSKLARRDGIQVLCNEPAQYPCRREGLLVRAVDILRNEVHDVTTVYQILDPKGKLAKQWGGMTVKKWEGFFATLGSGSLVSSVDALREYLKLAENDCVAEKLKNRLLKLHGRGGTKYCREQGRAIWEEPESPQMSSSPSPQMRSLSELMPVLQAGFLAKQQAVQPPSWTPESDDLPPRVRRKPLPSRSPEFSTPDAPGLTATNGSVSSSFCLIRPPSTALEGDVTDSGEEDEPDAVVPEPEAIPARHRLVLPRVSNPLL